MSKQMTQTIEKTPAKRLPSVRVIDVTPEGYRIGYRPKKIIGGYGGGSSYTEPTPPSNKDLRRVEVEEPKEQPTSTEEFVEVAKQRQGEGIPLTAGETLAIERFEAGKPLTATQENALIGGYIRGQKAEYPGTTQSDVIRGNLPKNQFNFSDVIIEQGEPDGFTESLPSEMFGGTTTRLPNAIPRGGIIFVTQEERESLKGIGYERFTIVPKGEMVDAVGVGRTTAELTKGINAPITVVGGLTRTQIKVAGARTTDVQDVVNLQVEQQREIRRVAKEFRAEPTAFKGEPGFVQRPTSEGKEYSLGSEYFDTLPSRRKLKSYFGDEGEFIPKTKPSEIDVSGFSPKWAGIKTGAFKLGMGVVETGLEIPFDATTRTIKFDESGQRIKNEVDINIEDFPLIKGSKVGERIKKVKDAPLGGYEVVGGVAVASPFLLYGGVSFAKTVKAKGFRKASSLAGRNLVGGLSPLKPAPGVYVLEPTKFKTVAQVDDLGGGFKGRTGVGYSSGGSNKLQVDVYKNLPSGGAKGGGVAFIESPALVVEPGGKSEVGRVLTEVRTDYRPEGVGRGRVVFPGGQGYTVDVGESLGGGASVVLSQPKKSLFVGESTIKEFSYPKNQFSLGRFGGVSETGAVRRFAGGRVTNVQRFLGVLRKIKTKVSEFGLEFDMPQLQSFGLGGTSRKSSSSFYKNLYGSQGGVTQQATQQTQGFVTPSPTFKMPKIKTTPKTFEILSGGGAFSQLKQQSKFYGTGQYEMTRQTSSLVGRTPTNLIQISPTKQKDILSLGITQTPKVDVGIKPREVLVSRFEQIPKFSQVQTNLQSTKLSTLTQQKQLLKLQTTAPRSPLLSFGFDMPKRGGFFFPPILPPPGIIEGRVKRPKSKRRLKRTPSLVSLEFDIRARKKREGEVTGLQLRPILLE